MNVCLWIVAGQLALVFRHVSVLGGLHVVAAVLALAMAAVVLVRTKGTTAHVRLGWMYVVLLATVDLLALLTYRDGAGPGSFHLLAVVSLATLAAAVVWSPRRRGSRQVHGILMIWSVAGLIGAGLAQGATATLPDAAPWPTVAATGVVCVLAALATWAVASSRPRVQLQSGVGSVELRLGASTDGATPRRARKRTARTPDATGPRR